jgi:putative ABC transport system ATP-binding protein
MTSPASPVAPVVLACDLVKRYASGSGVTEVRTTALDGVSVELPAGALACITGPSGSGKTTLLHVLAGLTAPDAGTVTVAGHDLRALDDAGRADLRRDLMGLVFQQRNLLPALTVGENVALPLLLAGASRAEARARVVEVLERVGLGGRGPSYPASLSGGEAQRVAIARAVSTRPRVIWADEPTGALDSAAAAGVLSLLRELVTEGSTVVLVTHDAAVAATADVQVRLRDGRRLA